MATLINKNKKILKQRQDFVEHNFEAMVGARKRRYNETPQQKQRTEFLEDYYLLYIRNKNKWQKLKEIIKKLYVKAEPGGIEHCVTTYIYKKMQELDGEDVED